MSLEMEVMELVDNEPTIRPFQCTWESCGKVRMRASSWAGPFHGTAPSSGQPCF